MGRPVGRPKARVQSVSLTTHISEDARDRLREVAHENEVNVGKIIDHLLVTHLPEIVRDGRLKRLSRPWWLPTEDEGEERPVVGAVAKAQGPDSTTGAPDEPPSPLPERSGNRLSCEELRERMAALHLTKKGLAKAVGVDVKKISRWLQDQMVPPDHVPAVLEFLRRNEDGMREWLNQSKQGNDLSWEEIKERLGALHLPQGDVASLVGIQARGVSQWFQDQKIPPGHVPKVLEFLHRKEDELREHLKRHERK